MALSSLLMTQSSSGWNSPRIYLGVAIGAKQQAETPEIILVSGDDLTGWCMYDAQVGSVIQIWRLELEVDLEANGLAAPLRNEWRT